MLQNFNNSLIQTLIGKFWAIKITIFVLLLSLFFSFPNIGSGDTGALSARAMAVQYQIDDLDAFWRTSEPTNAMFRITVPLIAKILALNLRGTRYLQFLTGVFIFMLTALITERETGDRLLAFYLTALVGLIYPGCAAFLEGRFYFDSFAYLFLLSAIWFRSPILIGGFILLAGFTDERAIIASGFVFLWWGIQNGDEYWKVKSYFNSRSLSVVFSLIIYISIRIFLQQHYGIQTWSEEHNEFLLFDQINNFPMGLWTGLEGGWLIITLALLAVVIRKRWIPLAIFVLILSIQSIAAGAVVDITRSMGYLLPGLFVGFLLLIKENEIHLRRIVIIACLISLISLNYGAGGKSSIWLFYPLPVQIIRWLFL